MQIEEISILDCVPFRDSPFKVRDDSDMEMLVDSIRKFGVMYPIMVRPTYDGMYEIVSGHRRVHACRKAGIDTVPALIREMDRDEAIICLVDGNLHRDSLLPSEKAFAYRMKVEALSHQGKTSVQVGQMSSRSYVARSAGESESQVQRYIRLTYLIKPILDLVDEGRIALTPAVELSYLSQPVQQQITNIYEQMEITPSFSQTVQIRKLSESGHLTEDRLKEIMYQPKANQKEYIRLSSERFSKFLSRFRSRDEMEDYVAKALDYYGRHLQRLRSDRDSR